jgi:hypothetical protein
MAAVMLMVMMMTMLLLLLLSWWLPLLSRGRLGGRRARAARMNWAANHG